MRLFRLVLFWLFVVTYLTVCPLTVLYALGYLYQPGTEGGRLVKTGLISLSTAPPGAAVYLGNKRYTKTTPTILRDLLPGDYAVKLTLKGHRPWTQVVPVEAEQATALERVLLLPWTIPQEPLVEGSFEQFLPLPGTPLGLLMSDVRLGDVVVFDRKDRRQWLLVPSESSWAEAKLLAHFTVPRSRRLLLRVELRTGERWLWMEIAPERSSLDDVTRWFAAMPQQVVWDASADERLFSLRDGVLNQVDVAARMLAAGIARSVRGCAVAEGSLYLVYEDGSVERRDLDGGDAEPLPPLPSWSWPLLGRTQPVQVHVVTPDLLLIVGERGELLVNRTPSLLIEKGVAGLAVDPQRSRVLVWKKDALGLVDLTPFLADEPLGPVASVDWLAVRAARIEEAFWVYEGSHALFLDGDHAHLVEVETYGAPHAYDLGRVKRRTAIAYDEATGRLAFLEATDGSLVSAEILPQRTLMSLSFPDRQEQAATPRPSRP